jgi:hypothetical protein
MTNDPGKMKVLVYVSVRECYAYMTSLLDVCNMNEIRKGVCMIIAEEHRIKAGDMQYHVRKLRNRFSPIR